MGIEPPKAGTFMRRVDGGLDFDSVYDRYWWPMLRLATGLLDSMPAAEDVVQEAFTALYQRRGALREPAAAVGYLRVCVVNGARSVVRRRMTARRHLRIGPEEFAESADHAALLTAEHAIVRDALRSLPQRQREVITLRYIAELTDPEIAAATGLSLGGVRSAASRGLAALRNNLEGAR